MDKKISLASDWLGIVCVAMKVIFRGLAAKGIWPIFVPADEILDLHSSEMISANRERLHQQPIWRGYALAHP